MKSILDCKDVGEALEWVKLHSLPFFDRFATEEELLHVFTLCDAYWHHSGRPEDPHAELTRGLCSNGFFDCLRVLKYLAFSEFLASQLAAKIEAELEENNLPLPIWVIGSPMAGITFAHDLARAIGVPINMCVEKDPQDLTGKRMIWNRMKIPPAEPVLQIEELTTTAGTLNEVRAAIERGNDGLVNFLPVVGILVHRPPELPVPYYGERKVVALIEKAIWAKPQDQCQLCAQGSERFRPKQNWEKLTGRK